MTISVSPVFNPAGHSPSSSVNGVLTVGSLDPSKSVLVALISVGQPFDHVSVLPGETFSIDTQMEWVDNDSGVYITYMYLLQITTTSTVVTLSMAGSDCSCAAVVGQLPAGDHYVQIPPLTYVDVPGIPGEVYANPQEVNNINAVDTYIPAWVPVGSNIVFGALFSHTYQTWPASPSFEVLDLQTVVGGDFEESNRATVSRVHGTGPSYNIRIQVLAFAIENANNDPVEIRINEASASEWRWAGVLGVLSIIASAGWVVGWA